MTDTQRRLAKVALAAVTIVLLSSVGGAFIAAPLLIPGHVWAARRASAAGRYVWCTLSALAMGMTTWAAVYVTLGEQQPAIWALPFAAFVASLFALIAWTRRPPVARPA